MTVIPNFIMRSESSRTIYEVEVFCTVEEGEFNMTMNPTIRPNRDMNSQTILPFATHSEFSPYITTIGLYNEDGELLIVGKLGQPIKKPLHGDITFCVRWDM